MQATVVAGIKAGLCEHFLSLAPCSVTGGHTRPDRAAIALDSDQQNLQPVSTTRDVVSQQRGRFIHVHHQHVDVTIVVKVAEGAPAAGVSIGDARSGFLDQLLESAVAKATENQAGRLERVRGKLFLHFRIDAAGHGEQVR